MGEQKLPLPHFCLYTHSALALYPSMGVNLK